MAPTAPNAPNATIPEPAAIDAALQAPLPAPLPAEALIPVPAGSLATVVTSLEITRPPSDLPDWRARAPERPDLTLERWARPELDAYRALFRAVGEPWLWSGRLVMPDDRLAALLHDPAVEVYVLYRDGAAGGLLELDFREPGQCELAYFGLTPALIGGGAGRFLMRHAQILAWRAGIGRFWVHTCTLDSPQALGFYRRWGFVPYAVQVETMADPRLTGVLPEDAAPQIPLIRPADARS